MKQWRLSCVQQQFSLMPMKCTFQWCGSASLARYVRGALVRLRLHSRLAISLYLADQQTPCKGWTAFPEDHCRVQNSGRWCMPWKLTNMAQGIWDRDKAKLPFCWLIRLLKEGKGSHNQMVWKSNVYEAEPRSFHVALRFSLIWTFSQCLSQGTVVLCYVAG